MSAVTAQNKKTNAWYVLFVRPFLPNWSYPFCTRWCIQPPHQSICPWQLMLQPSSVHGSLILKTISTCNQSSTVTIADFQSRLMLFIICSMVFCVRWVLEYVVVAELCATAFGLLQTWANNIFIILSSLKTMNKKLLALDAIIATIVSIVGILLFLAVVPVQWDFCARGLRPLGRKGAIGTRFESNSAKAYDHWGWRQRLDVDPAAFAMADPNLLHERGKSRLYDIEQW